ncbi:MAG: hypothetical protein QM669_07110 [Siphonobacter sp.]
MLVQNFDLDGGMAAANWDEDIDVVPDNYSKDFNNMEDFESQKNTKRLFVRFINRSEVVK